MLGVQRDESVPLAKAYLARCQEEGKTRREAIRALKRFIVGAGFKQWQRCLAQRATAAATS